MVNYSLANIDSGNTINAFPSVNKASVKSRKQTGSFSGVSALQSTREGMSDRITQLSMSRIPSAYNPGYSGFFSDYTTNPNEALLKDNYLKRNIVKV